MPSFSSSNEPSPRGSLTESNQQLSSEQSQLRIAALIEGLIDPDRVVRCEAARALGAIGGPDAVPALATALKDSEQDVRRQAAWALGMIGADARDAVPALAALLKDSEVVRYMVALALTEIEQGNAGEE